MRIASLKITTQLALWGAMALGCSANEVAYGPDEPVAEAYQAAQTCVTIRRVGPSGGSVADVSLDASSPDLNSGSGGPLLLQPSTLSLLRFDLSGIPAGAQIASAQLRLSEASAGTGPISLHRALAPWSEATVTWNSFNGAYQTTPSATRNNPAGTGALSFNVAALAQGWLDGAFENDGVALRQASGATSVYSSEQTPGAVRPSLKVCYTWNACADGVQNLGETGVDCGGPCGPCSADLAGLALSYGALSPAFDPATTGYAASLGYLAAGVSVTATLSDSLATLTIAGASATSGKPSEVLSLVEGANLIDVTVAAQDGSSQRTYTLSVDRAPLSTLAETALLKSSLPEHGAMFGTNTALDGDVMAVGARYEDSGVINSGAAYVLERDASGAWHETAYLKAPFPDADDVFGHTVRVSGDTLVVGLKWDDADATGDGLSVNNNVPDSGAAYVYRRDALGAWVLRDFLKASNAGPQEEFGYSIDIEGDTIAVGARFEDSDLLGNDGAAFQAGAVYIFERMGGEDFVQTAFLKGHDTAAGDELGYAVALSGDTLIATAQGNDGAGPSSGAAYIFVRSAPGVWVEQAKLLASNAEGGDAFGTSVAIDRDTVLVGARAEDSNGTSDGGASDNNAANQAGAAYVFVRDALGQWSQQGFLKAHDAAAIDGCGDSAGLSANTAVIGCLFKATTVTKSGAAIVFTRDAAGVWSEVATLQAHNADPLDHFGHSLALDGDTLSVGARFESSDGGPDLGHNNSLSRAGAQYVFGTSTCSDGQLSDVEADVDCGPVCGGCATGLTCYADADCASGVCLSGACQ